MEAACADKSMLPVTSDAYNVFSTTFEMCCNHQIFLQTWILPVIHSTFCILVFLHVSGLMAAGHCAMSAA